MITLYQSVAYSSGFLQRVKKLAVTSLYAAVAAAMFGVSVPTFLRGLGQPLPAGVPPAVFREWADRTHHLQVSTRQDDQIWIYPLRFLIFPIGFMIIPLDMSNNSSYSLPLVTG